MRLLCMTFALLAAAALAQDDAAGPAAAVPTSVATGAPEASGAESARATEAANDPAAVSEADADAGPVATTAANGVKTMSGMSILGNEETPTSLVIVPWKSSRLGDGVGVSNALDDSPRALDRDVFTRELRYYELRAGDDE